MCCVVLRADEVNNNAVSLESALVWTGGGSVPLGCGFSLGLYIAGASQLATEATSKTR